MLASGAACKMNSSMECHCLPLSDLPHTTKLFSTFLNDFSKVAKFFAHPPTEAGIAAAAREVHLEPAVRRTVVDVLAEQARRFGSDSSVARSLDRLGAGAVAVVTGQQVGLFSGPAYSFYKALATVRWAEEMTRRGLEAVPVFWLATEDHDLAEINHCFWPTRQGLLRFELTPNEEARDRRVGELFLGEAIRPIVARAAETLEGPATAEIARSLRESYAPGETFGTAFGKLMARLFVGRGVILLDPLDARFHRLAADVYLRAMEGAAPLRDALLARNRELERAAGFHAQVRVTRETTLLFYNVDGHRQPIRTRGGKFFAGEVSFTGPELADEIRKSPEAFTPNVLLRPVVQDTLLPTAAYVGGPAEIAYMAQAHVVYEKLLGRMPAILSRPGFTLVEPHVARLLKKYGLEIGDVFRGRQHLRSKMEQQSLPRGLEKRFIHDEKAFRKLLGAYSKPLGRLDKSLAGALTTAERKILHQFLKLRGQAGRAENFRSGILDRHERVLLDSLFPHREPQERNLCLLPFLTTHGIEFLDELARCAAPASPQHHLLFL